MSQNNFTFERNSDDVQAKRSYLLHLICIVILTLVLGACGGGSGSDSESTNTAGNPGLPGTPGSPTPVDPNNPNQPPMVDDQALFAVAVYPLLTDPANNCVTCHSGNPRIGTPDVSHPDIASAYGATVGQGKVNLGNPGLSRLYLRAAEDRHNCGGVEMCDAFATAMLAAIQEWATQSSAGNNTGNVVASAVTNFSQVVEGSIPRADANMITMFAFDEGTGDTAVGTSNVGAGMTLTLEGTEWAADGGLRNVSGKAQASLADSQNLFNLLSGNNQFSVEAWVIPENTDQAGPARIVSYSIDTGRRNFTLGQNANLYSARVQTIQTGPNGSNPELRTEDAVSVALTHLVMTYDNMSGGRKIYINGELAAEETLQGDMLNWQDDNLFVLGNEVTNDRLWQGVYKMVAIHNKALNGAEISQNFNAGAGAITSLRFDVASVLGAPGYVEMQAYQIDPQAYVFARPKLVSDSTGVAVKNIRIAVNNSTPVAAQAFRRVDTMITESGQEISPLGALIPADLGMEMDQFHLEFEVLGGQTGTSERLAPSTPPAPAADVPEPDAGVRTFSQVHDTMAALTGVSQGNGNVRDRYDELRNSLPPTADVLGFGSAQQIAIQRMATTYCGVVVGTNNNSRCRNFFNDDNCAIAAGEKDAIAGTVYDKIIGNNLANQPARAAVISEFVSMMNDLNCVNGCNDAQGREVLQAVCAAALASSAVTLN